MERGKKLKGISSLITTPLKRISKKRDIAIKKNEMAKESKKD